GTGTDWAAASGGPSFKQQDVVVAANAFTNVDFDMSAFLDNAFLVEARVIGATKNGGAHMTDSAYAASFAMVNNKKGTLTFGSQSLGLPVIPNNPMQTADSHTPVREPMTTDAGLQGGGGQPWQADAQLPGGTTLRVRVNSSAPINCPARVFLTI